MASFRWVVAALIALALAAGVACNAGGDGGDSRKAERTDDQGAPTRTSDGDDTSGDAELATLERFNYTVSFELTIEGEGVDESVVSAEVTGSHIAPDRHAWTDRYAIGSLKFSESYIIIGDDAWTRSGSGRWTATTASDPDVVDATDLTSADPVFADEEFAEDIGVFDSTDERRNGIETRRIAISQADFGRLSSLFGSDFLPSDLEGFRELAFTVWLSKSGDHLIAAELEALVSPEFLSSDGDFPFDIPPGANARIRMALDREDINDDSIVIEPPE
jgi:hypothetical protein